MSYTEVEILCALRLDAVVLRAVEVRDCPKELAGREVLINMAVPCILKAQFQLCGDGMKAMGETTHGRNDLRAKRPTY